MPFDMNVNVNLWAGGSMSEIALQRNLSYFLFCLNDEMVCRLEKCYSRLTLYAYIHLDIEF
jgi:hypothetical protein